MKRVLVVLSIVAAAALLILAIAGGWARYLVPGGGAVGQGSVVVDRGDGQRSSGDPDDSTLSFGEGDDLELGAVIGFHVDLGDDWAVVDNQMALGYLQLENTTAGCSLVLMLAKPYADFPHHLEDEPGSFEILDRYASGLEDEESFDYPVHEGGAIQTLLRSSVGPSGSRVALAREFGAIDVALMVDLGCGAGIDAHDVLVDEVAVRFPATVALP